MKMAKKDTKIARKRGRRIRPVKMAALVVSAIQDLRETKGSTSKKIMGYISYTSNMSEKRVKRQVKAALKRGVQYGILRKYRGHYFLPTSDELEHASRVGLRFAGLPTQSMPLLARSKIITVGKIKDRKRLRGIDNRARKNTKVGKSCSFSSSTNPSFIDKIASDVVSVKE